MELGKVYCSAPWKGITVREDGRVRTCCSGKNVLGDLHVDHISDVLKSPRIIEIKDSLTNGNFHPNCQRCANAEKEFNYATLRHHYQKHYPMDDNDFSLNFLDIRWNNKCNLACVYCDETFSSVWENRLGKQRNSARRDYDQELLNWILAQADSINELMLLGGEPMLMKQNHELLKYLPKTTKISIITNLSYDFQKLPCLEHLIDRPAENTIWNVSLENTGKKFEYVRHGASWNQLEKNIKFLTQQWPNTVSLNMVYSLLSALDIDKTMQYFDSVGVSKFNLMPIDKNKEMSMAYMPESIKQHARDTLDRVSIWHNDRFGIDKDLYPIDGLTPIKESMSLPTVEGLSKSQVLKKIDQLDQWHTERFQDLWSFEYQLLIDNLE